MSQSDQPQTPNRSTSGNLSSISPYLPLVGAVTLLVGAIWWAAWISFSVVDFEKRLDDLEFSLRDYDPGRNLTRDDLDPFNLKMRIDSLESEGSQSVSRVEHMSVQGQITMLRERTINLSSRMLEVEQTQNLLENGQQQMSMWFGTLFERTGSYIQPDQLPLSPESGDILGESGTKSE